LRKAKASAKTGWTYYRELVKLLHEEVGEEKTAGIICKLMKGMAHRYFDASMQKFGIEGNDAWSLASYFKLATGDVVGYKAELIQEGPKKVVYRLYPPCLWFPELDIPPAFCLAEDCFEEEVCRMHNPKVKVYCGMSRNPDIRDRSMVDRCFCEVDCTITDMKIDIRV